VKRGDPPRAKLRAGLVGCGEMGALRAAALARTPSLRLVAVSDVAAARAGVVASVGDATIHDNWRTLVRSPDLDLVIVSTPPGSHREISVEALRAGRNVLCEKPLARTPAECRAMVDAARESGRLLASGFNYRFYPSVKKAATLVRAGRIGELTHVFGHAGYSAIDQRQTWLRDVDVSGGGAFRDNGIHLIDLARYFLGDVEDIQTVASNSVWGFPGCEDNGFILMQGTRRRVASLHASWTHWGRFRFAIELSGTRGHIRAWCFPMVTQVTWADEQGGPTHRRLHLFPATNIAERLRSYRWVVVCSLVDELEAFADAIGGRSTAGASGEDGLRAVEIADAVSKSLARVDPAHRFHASGA
jgi:predicted dehydrogenase